NLCWCENAEPKLDEARKFAEAIKAEHPDQLLDYNYSPSLNWKMHLAEKEMESFQRDNAAMGYKLQFVTLAGFHTLNHSMFELANQYKDEGMAAYYRLQQTEFESEDRRNSATRNQRKV